MKKFMSIILTLALCFMLVPVQPAYAAYYGENYDFTAMTDEQIEEAFFGNWRTYSEFLIDITEDGLYYNNELVADWIYKGVTTVNNAPLSADDFGNRYNGLATGETKALRFETENSVIYVHPCWEADMDRYCLSLYEYNLETGEYITAVATIIKRFISEEDMVDGIFFEEVLDKVLAGEEVPIPKGSADKEDGVTEDTSNEEPEEDETTEDTSAEEPKEDETTEDTSAEEPKEDETTEDTSAEEPKKEEATEADKKVVSKTKDGREVYEGEEVYIVKKGDCLWAIAKQLLGNGARYNELFTRNNGIVKKATLIFPGQEIIVPTK